MITSISINKVLSRVGDREHRRRRRALRRAYGSLPRDNTNKVTAAYTMTQSDLTSAKELSYVETDFREYTTNKFVARCADAGIDVLCEEFHFDLIPNISKIVGDVLGKLNYHFVTLATSNRRTQFVTDEGIVTSRSTATSTFVEILGNQKLIDNVGEKLLAAYEEISAAIEWVISTDGSSVTIPLYAPHGVTDSSYPFIEEGVAQFVDDFMASSENVLLLIGPPGTGKSSLLKYLVARSKQNALITYDPEIMKKDGIFANFLEGDASTLILEDADSFLGARTEGNIYMSRFLNLGSGLISMPNKKLIFSTNLPNLDDVDPALLRAGRCWGVIHFRKLTHTESVQFLKDHNITHWAPTPGEEYSLAELYAHVNKSDRTRTVENKRKVGFY